MPPPLPTSSPLLSAAAPSPRRRPRDHPDDPDHHDEDTAIKRHRAEYTFSPTIPGPSTTAMSAKLQGTRPLEVIDLTRNNANHPPPRSTIAGLAPPVRARPTGLQTHLGTRKLVVKNLKPASAVSEDYWIRTRAELDEGLTAIFAGVTPPMSLERLYRGVEDLCRHGEATQLYKTLSARCEKYLLSDEMIGKLKRQIVTEELPAGLEDIILEIVFRKWGVWSHRLMTVRRVYAHLDRSHLLPNSGRSGAQLQSINDLGISLFRRAVFGGRKDPNPPKLGGVALQGVLELSDRDRHGRPGFRPILFKQSIALLKLFGVYGKLFEPRFLAASHEFYKKYGEEESAGALGDYIKKVATLLQVEGYRCDMYGFDSTTKRQLLEDAHRVLIHQYADKLVDSGSVGLLLGARDVSPVKALYQLLTVSGLEKSLKGPFSNYIKATGAEIVGEITRGDEMVIRLLELRKAMELMVRDAFERDEVYKQAMRDAFGHFINEEKTTSTWNTGTSIVGENIAKHIDMLLRGGLKTLPQSVLSDTTERADQEQSGLASTGDESAELDRQLENALKLFRHIKGKDVFQAFYKKDLARRILLGRSASQDAERNMIAKLKTECGSDFTHNIEQMFKDQELAKDEMKSYKDWLAGSGRSKSRSGVELSVNILSAAAWPTFPDVKVLLPKEVMEPLHSFDTYYKSKHTGRQLTWKHNVSHCVIKAKFDRSTKELLVSALQAAVLVLFNDAEEKTDGVLSYEQISQGSGLTGGDLDRTLQSLACGKTRVLTKHPKGREVSPTDTFTVNKTFSDPKFRIKINQIQLKETRQENKETHERVARDRQFETQAAIVRIMKSRKTMTHPQLVAEVINQTKARGAVDPADIKANIEKLIEKDYLDREDGNYVYQA
ncbi:Cullin family-domain-containing protein [Podospora australis]|uniref:Cullin family-domain-containing protein n=1 Tax=Podospora australis TaxID=1536484 RepID=A0AAN6WYB8_9PEZI|nr:Cullin family-domain-containing protein [Podospora australis]